MPPTLLSRATEAAPSAPVRPIPGGFIVDTGTEAGRQAMARILHVSDAERAKWAIAPLPPSGLPGGVLYSARDHAEARLENAFAAIDAVMGRGVKS